MLRFFQNKNPLMFLFYVAISIIIVLDVPIDVIDNITNSRHAFLYNQILFLIKGDYFVIFYRIILAALLLINAIIYNKLIVSIKLLKVNNYFSGFTFLILIGFALIKVDCLAVLFSSALIILAIKIIFNTLRKGIAIFEYLNVGLLFSIAFLFWETTLYFFILIFISILILRIQNWREWLVSLIGLFLPIFITSSIYFFIYSDFDIIFDTYQLLFFKKVGTQISYYELVVLIFVLLLSLTSSFKILSRFNSIETNNQDYYKIFSFLFLISVLVSFLIPSNIYNNYVFAIIPLNIVFSTFFISLKNKIIPEILFNLFLISSVYLYLT